MHSVLHPVNRARGSICANKVKGAVMKEVINLIFSTWQSYWNGSGYPYLLAGTVLFILAGLFLRGQYGRKKYIKFGQNPEKDDRKSEIENSIVNKEQSEACREDADRTCTKARAGAVGIYTLLSLAAFFRCTGG